MALVDDLWVTLYDAFGIGRAAEPATIAAVFFAALLSILVGCAAGKLVLWLPGAIGRLLFHLGELLGNTLDSQSGRAEAEVRNKPTEEAKPFLMPKVCTVCGLENTAEKIACERCKNPFTLKSAMELTQPNKLIEDVLRTDSEFAKQLEEKLVERIMKQVEAKMHGVNYTMRRCGPEEI